MVRASRSNRSLGRSCDTLIAMVRYGPVPARGAGHKPVSFRTADRPEDFIRASRVPTDGSVEGGTPTSLSDWGWKADTCSVTLKVATFNSNNINKRLDSLTA